MCELSWRRHANVCSQLPLVLAGQIVAQYYNFLRLGKEGQANASTMLVTTQHNIYRTKSRN
ncbi:hypothetical protein O9992_25490 [Vibrio lentus]|nr:hypothetical protein [Vibrio lentus]